MKERTDKSSSSFWDTYPSWESAHQQWEENAKKAKKERPLRGLHSLPQIPGITEETKKHLKWKSFVWMITQDHRYKVLRSILRRPFFHLWNYIKSLWNKKPFIRDKDFFLYGLSSVDEMKRRMEDPSTVLIVGFSYCEKPHECPSGRFNDTCIRDLENQVCQQCFIGKALHTLPKENTFPLLIPTIHYIAEKIFEIQAQVGKGKKILFLITACEMTLQMFGDWGNMAGIQGVGVRLDGRICNTMRAFELSEKGIKPGLTVVLPETEERILELLSYWRKIGSERKALSFEKPYNS